MKVKKCCDDYDKIAIANIPYLSENLVPSIWHIPEGCWEEMGEFIEIKFCPFCGVKIEMVNE